MLGTTIVHFLYNKKHSVFFQNLKIILHTFNLEMYMFKHKAFQDTVWLRSRYQCTQFQSMISIKINQRVGGPPKPQSAEFIGISKGRRSFQSRKSSFDLIIQVTGRTRYVFQKPGYHSKEFTMFKQVVNNYLIDESMLISHI